VTSPWKARHDVGKLLTRATTLIEDSSRSEFGVRSYGRLKFLESSRDTFGTPFRESQQNVPFGCSRRDQPQKILYGGSWWLPPNSGRGESCVSKCPWQIPTPKGVPNYRNPALAKCGGEAQHLEKLEVGSLLGLPNVQSSTARPKTPRIRVFLVSLERSWNVDIENGLALAIRTFAAQVMGKTRAGTPDH
jgi:hypothetical protein